MKKRKDILEVMMRRFSKHLATVLAVAALSLSASSAVYAHDRGHNHNHDHGWWNFISSWFHPHGFDHGRHEGHDRGHGHHKGLHNEHNPWDSYADNDSDDDDGSGGGTTTDTSGGGSTPPANTCSNGLTGTDVSFQVVDEYGSYGAPTVTYCSSNTVEDVITGSFPGYTTATVDMQLCHSTVMIDPMTGTMVPSNDCSGTQTTTPLDPTQTLQNAGVVDDAQNADDKVYLEPK